MGFSQLGVLRGARSSSNLVGGSGRKYSVYALARRLAIESRLSGSVVREKRRGMYRMMGRRGSASRMRV